MRRFAMKRGARSLPLLTAEQFHRISRAVSDNTRYDILRKVFASSGLTCGGAAEGLPISAATVSPKARGLCGCAATARDARAALLGIERSTARCGSGALRNIGCVHAPPLATTCLLRGWVHASVAEVRLSPRSVSFAAFCGLFAAAP